MVAGGEEAYHEWHARLASVTQRYSRILFLGDSMGASGALLFSDLATAILASGTASLMGLHWLAGQRMKSEPGQNSCQSTYWPASG